MGCTASNPKELVRSPSYLASPDLTKRTRVFSHGVLNGAVSEMQGWREYMEDFHSILNDSAGEKPLLVGIFDGHNGGDAGLYCKEHMLKSMQNHPAFHAEDLERCAKEVFKETDEKLAQITHDAGSTALVAMVTKDDIQVAHVGDSRCVLSGAGRQFPLSIDHKPSRKAERRRILNAGGFLDNSDPENMRVGCKSVLMTMAMSRSLGDFDFKYQKHLGPEEQIVICTPDFIRQQRTSSDRFLVLASDGIWDAFSNVEIVLTLDDLVNQGINEVSDLAETLIDQAYWKGSSDNMTVILIDLRPQHVKEEDARNAKLELQQSVNGFAEETKDTIPSSN